MSDPDLDEWTPILDRPLPGSQFKWALNGETGRFLVWQVGGPGDGLPTHLEVLPLAWGRDDLHRPGDVLGGAWVDNDSVRIWNPSSKETPAEVLEWAKQTFPEHQICGGR